MSGIQQITVMASLCLLVFPIIDLFPDKTDLFAMNISVRAALCMSEPKAWRHISRSVLRQLLHG